ncbi:hypothetical protein LTR12_014806 [Friedmanniomyces endolithicus]|nr:hypothetical protein LTR12_014806 [Friedmanniomyces endolithicus]
MHSPLPSTLRFLLFAFLPASTSADNCYWRSQYIINDVTGWFACNNTQVKSGGAQLCCLNGAQCGADSLCYMPGGTSGNEWFVGGCTDRTYGDPVCRGSCTGDDQTWIFYNATASKWQCCGNSACGTVTSTEQFQAIMPNQWTAVPTVQTSSSTASSMASSMASPMISSTTSNASTSASTSSVASLNSNNRSNSIGGGHSTGAQAGIGVGCAAAGVGILVAIVLWIVRGRESARDWQGCGARWQSQQQQGVTQTPQSAALYYEQAGKTGGAAPGGPPQPSMAIVQESKPVYPPQELGGSPTSPQELPEST